MMSDYVQNEDEEISLVELFAVLLKYRKLIILGTGIVSLLAAMYLFFIPKIIPSLERNEVTAIFTIKENPLPVNLSNGLKGIGTEINTQSSLTSAFRSLPSIALLYKETPFLGKNYPSDSDMYNMFISKVFSQNSKIVEIKKALVPNTYELDFKISRENFDYTEEFVRKLINLTNESLSATIASVLPLLKNNTEASIKRIEDSKAQINDITTLQSLHDLLFEINQYQNSDTNDLLKVQDDTFIIGSSKGKGKKFLIVFFAAFFCFVFIAFIKNGINSAMEDSSSKKILLEAWEEGK